MIPALVLISTILVLEPVSVQRWSSDQPIVGEIVSFGPQGIGLREEGSVLPMQIAWYEFRSVEPTRPEIEAYQSQAITAWRAHTRRQRGDLSSALPNYETLRRQYLWYHGKQSEEVSLGLAQCLIDAGRRNEAVLPMLSWFVAAESHAPGVTNGESMIDDQALLMPALPPVFTTSQRHAGLGDLPDSSLLTDRERLLYAEYAMVFGQGLASESQLDEIEQLRRALRARDAGTILVEQMVFAQAHPDPSKRQAARDALSRRTRTQRNSWLEVWSRLGLGAALLRDDDPNEKERGVIELLHVVTRLSAVDPGLTLLAADLANDYLESTGRAAWGRQIIHDARANLMNLDAAAPALAQENQIND